MRWRLPRLAVGAAAVLAVVSAVVPAAGPGDDGGAMVTSADPADGTTPARAPTERPAADPPAPVDGHRHDVDPVSAGLLVVDGLVALAVVVLLIRRPRRRAPVRR